PQRGHLAGGQSAFAIRQRLRLLGDLLVRPICLVAWGIQLTGMVPLVAITTIMAVFLVKNLGYPGGALWVLYLVGGGANFLLARYLGRAVDKLGSVPMAIFSTIL